MGIGVETYANWEKSKTEPVASQFRPVAAFLGYDPTPAPSTLAARLQAKRRALGVTFSQVARVPRVEHRHPRATPKRKVAYAV
jgi:transcriptional regulator with XRE-family HTH domain